MSPGVVSFSWSLIMIIKVRSARVVRKFGDPPPNASSASLERELLLRKACATQAASRGACTICGSSGPFAQARFSLNVRS